MTTNDRVRARPARADAASGLGAYLLALLATAYVAVWWMLGAPGQPVAAAPTDASAPREQPTGGSTPPRTAWFHELPASERPVVVVPAGWHLADPTVPQASVPPPVAARALRVSSARPGRIRTRSS